MKVRKLAVALALAGGLGSGLAQALGMGEGRILTNLNEPLRAEIEISEPRDLSADQIKVSLAPESEFERAGLRRMDVLHDLKFEVVESDGGFQIEVTSEGPIREPFLNFLVELTWPKGRLLREYSFLVDPPSRDPGPEAIGPSAETEGGGTQARSEPASQRQQQQASTAAAGAPEEYGPTGANDTLWGIAGEVSPSSDLNRHQVMLAIQDANPKAFANNNINEMRRGHVLRIPPEEAMRSRSRQEAIQQVVAQNERHQQGTQRQASTDSSPRAPQADDSAETAQQAPSSEAQPSPGESGDDGEDELRILVADGENSGDDGTMAGMGDGEGDERLASALEELDRAERDREELSDRLADLEKQLDTMSQLIELKDDQLAEMEQRLAEARENNGASDVQASGETAEAAQGGSGEAPDAQSESTDSRDDSGSEVVTESEAQQTQGQEPTTGDEESEPAVASSSGGESGDGDGAAQSDSEQTEGKGAPANLTQVFQRVVNDPRYQIGAGVLGIGLLGLLWGLARRNAAREQAFYDQLKDVAETSDEPVEDEQALDLSAAADESEESLTDAEQASDSQDGEDALAEADVYLAYGRHEQAARHLEQAISAEPSRVDLRLKLLGVYADAGESENFEKQYRELSAFNDDDVMQQADDLRSQLDTSDEDISIEDLTEQLKTGTGSEAEMVGESPGEEQSPVAEDLLEDDEFDFSALDDVDDLLGESSDVAKDTATSDSEKETEEEAQAEEFSIDFDLGEDEKPVAPEMTDSGSETEEDVADLGFSMDDLELEEPREPENESVPELDAGLSEEQPETGSSHTTETAETTAQTDAELTLDELDLELETEAPAPSEEKPEGTPEAPAQAESGPSSESEFDDSFLEELDAELDRVTGEEAESDEPVATTAQAPAPESDDELEDLALDVSEEDLELAEEVAQEGMAEDPQQPGQGEASTDKADAPADQLEESLMDSEADDLGLESALSDDELAALEGEETQTPAPQQRQGAAEMESESVSSGSEGSDEEFDFLEGTDEAGTKLDLARAYVEMGDADGARDILEEVAREGSEDQQKEAQRLLNEL
ncbi:FimV/HubP family polar landmark protein [Salicola sp. Rm-C-2C1-2]|uniref:FimV/HubP family polar landmark protein n=1 Tax=Salicola sp. Rm-C-2C1-2 TaxID=3141321 RepID=UPI0032E37577